jgi:beta-lactamase class A
MGLKDIVSEAAEGFDGDLGVSIRHLGNGEAARVKGRAMFPLASVFKVPVIVEYFRQVDEGKLDPDEAHFLTDADKVPGSGILKELTQGMPVTYRDLLHLMMIVSDNTATDLVAAKVGFDKVNAAMRTLGLKKTKVTRYCREILFDLVGINDLEIKEMTLDVFQEAAESGEYTGSWSLGVEDNDVSTPDEMTKLLGFIVDGKAASRESCDQILTIMGKCQTGSYRIPKYLPGKEVTLQRKTGSLPGIRNDVGVVTVKATGEKYAITCFTKGAADVYAAEEAIAQVSLKAYEYFTESG